jgi:hypothetical protein
MCADKYAIMIYRKNKIGEGQICATTEMAWTKRGMLIWPFERMMAAFLFMHLLLEGAFGHYQQKPCLGLLRK